MKSFVFGAERGAEEWKLLAVWCFPLGLITLVVVVLVFDVTRLPPVFLKVELETLATRMILQVVVFLFKLMHEFE